MILPITELFMHFIHHPGPSLLVGAVKPHGDSKQSEYFTIDNGLATRMSNQFRNGAIRRLAPSFVMVNYRPTGKT